MQLLAKRNVIVGQSGGPTAAINSSLAGVYRTAIDRGYKKVYGMLHGVQGLIEGRYIDLSEHITSALDSELLKRTPASYLGSCRYKLPEIFQDKELYEKIFKILEDLEIDCFIYIGGNDSMDTIKKLSDYAMLTGSDIRFVGCPKTIDNDLALTDHTPGYGSAAKYIGTSVKEVIRDGLSMRNSKGLVTVIEIMGRNAGWLTGASVLAKGEDCDGPDAIYLPELDFDVDAFVEKCRNLLKTKNSVVVCVSEGIHTADGKYVMELGENAEFVDAFGHKQLTGTARVLCNILSSELGCKARAIEFSTLQRAASHCASRIDINEAFEVGGAAMKAADEGDTGKMVVFVRTSSDPYAAETEVKDVHKIANDERLVPREWVTEDGSYVTPEFRSYVDPLIQGDVSPVMVDGIPRHLYKPGYQELLEQS
ncbi:MAG: 6-phosphofructokinase [Lachnospiraceae bacterium]|nr:6-phosphofructokinase [Lachnospiraceae bacterium]